MLGTAHLSRQTLAWHGLTDQPKRGVQPRFLPKNRETFRPWFHDYWCNKRDARLYVKKPKFTGCDPIYFAHHLKTSNGGYAKWLEHVHETQNFGLPLNRVAYILYNAAKAGAYDNEIFVGFERELSSQKNRYIESRHCFGAVYAYYRSMCGTQFGLDFWLSRYEENQETIKVFEVTELLRAFDMNRKLPRDHMIDLLDNFFKKHILKHWDE